MMKNTIMLNAIILAALPVMADRLDDATARAKELCAKMTLEEKAGELMVYDYNALGVRKWEVYEDLCRKNEIGAMMRVLSPELTRKMQDYKLAHSRLKIPLIVHEDITHGWATTLPIQMCMACSWDDEAIERGEAVSARESAAIGINMTYSPQVEVSDDPRWGRIGATNGEDPYLSARVTAARVRGDQGRSLDELADGEHVIACVKHFIGYSSLQGGKDYRHRDFSRRELFETHLPPHKAAIDAGALAVMNAYTVFEGVPCNFNRYLLTDLLRGQLGFRGQLVTDWTTLQFSIDEGACQDQDEAAVRGLRAGVDMDMIARTFLELPRLVREGKVKESEVDVAVVRSLALKFLMGLFDDPYRFCRPGKAKEELFSKRNQRDVLELTREALVLLKNNGVLPLDPSKPVGLAGVFAEDANALRGGMNKDFFCDATDPSSGSLEMMNIPTIRSAMQKRWGQEKLQYSKLDMIRLARGEDRLPEADTVVLTIGEPVTWTGERRGRAKLQLPEDELERLRTLKRAGKKVVSVVFGGRPFLMNEIDWLSDAVLFVWYPGAMGGEAIAEILSGEVNPSGRLCQTFPLDQGQIPITYREKRTFIPCGYADLPATPLYPFGYGLSYTTFEYSKPLVKATGDESAEVRVTVKNTGSFAGREVVQLYVRDDAASVLPRERELKEFTSVRLKPGESKEVVFNLGREAFALYDAELKEKVEPGSFTIYVGGSSTTMNAAKLYLGKGSTDALEYEVKVSKAPVNTGFAKEQRPEAASRKAVVHSVVSKGPYMMAVYLPKPTTDLVVRPLSKDVKVFLDVNRAVFTLPGPGQYIFEAGTENPVHHIFVDAPKAAVADGAGRVLRYAPGEHYAGRVMLESGTTVVVERGATVYGSFFAVDAENVVITGGGIISGRDTPRKMDANCLPVVFGGQVPAGREALMKLHDEQKCPDGPVRFYRAKNCRVEDVTLVDPPCWTLIAAQCEKLAIDNVKVIGWRYNSDGFDLCNCRDVTVRNCFLRCFDDCVVLKGISGWDSWNVERITVENCVIWCDWGRNLETGAETNAPEFRDLVFRNCDCIHGSTVMLDLNHHNRAFMHDILFEDIRCEYTRHQLADVTTRDTRLPYPDPAPKAVHPLVAMVPIRDCPLFSKDGLRGRTKNAVFRNIRVLADEGVPAPGIEVFGYDRDHTVENIVFENFTLNGRPWKPAVTDRGFTKGIEVR